MARWEPDAEQRLRDSAIAQFCDRGYDSVTAADIADGAGLARRSFFRYFPDKRDVLFAGSQQLVDELANRLNGIRAHDIPRVALATLTDVGSFLLIDRVNQRRRRDIIDSSPELLERERTKTAAIARVVEHALAAEQTSGHDAEFIGVLCAETFRSAYRRALSTDVDNEFFDHMSGALATVHNFLQSRVVVRSEDSLSTVDEIAVKPTTGV